MQELQTFLEEHYNMLAHSYEELLSQSEENPPDFGILFASVGIGNLDGHPYYPAYNVPKTHQPSEPGFKAIMARETVNKIAKRYQMTPWDKVSASCLTANKAMQSFLQSNTDVNNVSTAMRLIMEGASWFSRLTVAPYNAVLSSLSSEGARGFMADYKKAQIAVKAL